MKIMLVTFLYDPKLGGGAAQVVNSLAHELKKRGHEVVVITTSPEKKKNTHFEDEIKIISFCPPNLYWVYDKDKHPIWQKIIWQIIDIWNPNVYKIFKKIVQEEKPDIVHVHKLRGLSPSVWNAAFDAGVRKIVQTCHDYEIISPQGTLSGIIGKLVLRKSLLLFPYQYIRKQASRKVNVFTTPGKEISKTILASAFFQNADSIIVPNSHGFTLEEIERNNQQTEKSIQQPLKILFIGRLELEKGIWNLCKAVQQIGQNNTPLELFIAGSGSEQNKLIQHFSDTKFIHFCGYMEGLEKELLFRGCDVIAVPSIVPESFCISAIEALAYGKPVIINPIGELPNLIENEVTGFYMQSTNVQGIIDVIMKILENRQVLIDMRTTCYDKAKQYSLETITQQYLTVYNEKG